MVAPASERSGEESSKPFTVAIVGGGLGGVVLAVGLLAHRVPFHIYEAARSFGEIGAGVAFGPNAVRSLGLISPELQEALAKHATFNASPELQETFLSFRHGQPSQCQEADRAVNGERVKGPGAWLFDLKNERNAINSFNLSLRCCVHRAKFLDEIIKLVPKGTASFNKSLTKVEERNADEGGGVQLFFSDGTSAIASAAIGCDGIKSRARDYIHGPEAQPVFSGSYAFRAMVPSEAFEKAMGTEQTFNGQMHVGNGGYIVTYPVEHGKLINVVASRAKHEGAWSHDAWLSPSTKEEMTTELQGWHPALIDFLSKYGTMEKWALFDYHHQKTYCRGRVCLLGDAAHATTPHLGAGAGQAMEDAYVLSNLLGEAEKAEDLQNVFQAYDGVRRQRTQRVVDLSRLSGLALSGLEDGVGLDSAKLEEVSIQRFRSVWNEDVQRELDKAKAGMAPRRGPRHREP